MKKAAFLIILLIISNNVFIFLYGIIQQADASAYLSSEISEQAVNSALVLALHDYEDSGRPGNKEGSASFNGFKISYRITDVNNTYLYIRIIASGKSGKAEKEFFMIK